MTALIVTGLLAALVAVAWLGCALAFAAGRPAPQMPFDDHTTTAPALLQPDHHALPGQPSSFIEQVEAYVAAHAPKES